MPTNFFFFLMVALVTQGFLLVFALLTSRHSNKTANYLLSGLIALFSFYALIKILSNTSGIIEYPHLIRTYRPIFILACALVYFYCKALTSPGFRFTWTDTLHLIPFAGYTIIMIPFFFSDPATKIASLSSQPFTLSWTIERSFWVIVFFSYFGFSYKIVLAHQRHIKEFYSNIEKIKLDWLKNLLMAFGVIWMTALFRFLTAYGKVGYENKLLVPVLLCMVIFLIGWHALRQPEIFSDRWDKLIMEDGQSISQSIAQPIAQTKDQEAAINTAPAAPPKEVPAPASLRAENSQDPVKQPPKYEYSSLSKDDISRHKDSLIKYLEVEKPYIDPDLKLQNLADHLGIPSYQLSQIINTEMKLNFYELINSMRILEAKQRLLDPANQNITIIAIAFDVGFNSKSTFNTAFKKYVNMTPSQYKKSHTSDA